MGAGSLPLFTFAKESEGVNEEGQVLLYKTEIDLQMGLKIIIYKR